LLCLDELGVIDSRELTAAVYQLAIGAGKGRARRDGSMRPPASWRVMVVSTGEISIASKVEEDKNRRARAVKKFAFSTSRLMLAGDMAPSMPRARVRIVPRASLMKW
jgi:uncharacterized protein (DUF927 family)